MLVAIKNTFDSLLNLINGKADKTYVDNKVAENGGVPAGSRLANIQAMNLPSGQIIKGGAGQTVSAFNVDDALANKADKSTTYTKTEINNTRYTKTEVNNLLNNKADKSTTYTKTEVDSAIGSSINTYNDNITKSTVGLGNVQNYGISTKAEAENGTVNNKYMTPLRTKEAIMAQVGGSLNNYYTKTESNDRYYTKTEINNTRYTKSEVDGFLNNKASITQLNLKSDITYVNQQINTRAKKPIILTTVPTNPSLYEEGDIIFVIENP